MNIDLINDRIKVTFMIGRGAKHHPGTASKELVGRMPRYFALSASCSCPGCANGDRCEGIALVHWFQDGAITADWPAFQRHDNWSRLVVAKRGKVFSYEHVAEIIPVTSEFEAWGSGRDFAIGALEMGADARKAVEIANQYNIYCGFGVDVFSTGPVVLRQAST